jgi:hypothetical protein
VRNIVCTGHCSLLKTLWKLDRPHIILGAYCDQMLGNQDLIKRLKSETFDVTIVDLLYNECGLALAHHIRTPAIGFWAQSFSGQVRKFQTYSILKQCQGIVNATFVFIQEADLTTADLTPSVVPFYTTQNPRNMSFLQRVLNVAMKGFMWTMTVAQCYYCDFFIQRHLPGEPGSLDLLGNLNGFLINSHPILDSPRLLPDTFISVGGLQIKKKLGTLPEVLIQAIKAL